MSQKVIEVRSRQHAKDFKWSGPWAAISVSTEPGDFPPIQTENRVGLLRLRFWDIANPRLQDIDRLADKLFSREQAEAILKFVDDHWPHVECFMVHCEAGISRSPAIAAAIEYIYHGKDEAQKYFNRYMPNSYVYKTLLEVKFNGDPQVIQDARQVASEKIYGEPWDCKE